MKRVRTRERRCEPRYRFGGEFRGRELRYAADAELSKLIFGGKIKTISHGGLSLSTNQLLRESHLVRGEIFLPNLPCGVPSLMQVKWVKRSMRGPQYHVGMQFLL